MPTISVNMVYGLRDEYKNYLKLTWLIDFR